MEKRKLARFLKKFAEDTHSETEHSEFITWLQEIPENELPQVLNELSHFFEQQPDLATPDLHRILQAIEDQIDAGNKEHIPIIRKRRLLLVVFRAAAVVVLLSGGLFLFQQKRSSDNLPTQAKPVSAFQKIKPGRNQAFLTLSDGNIIALEHVKNGQLATVQGIEIDKISDGVVRLTETQLTDRSPGNIKINIPTGGQYKVILTDGTEVWLNASSTLTVPLQFSAIDRSVTLFGEGYFEVAKNRLKQFKVNANGTEVRVYGTHFNISAYPDERTVKTDLLEGSVKIVKGNSSRLLIPGQQARVMYDDIHIVKANVLESTEWKNGNFNFAHEDIKTIMRKIARWYDVDVTYSGDVTNQGFLGTIPRSAEITDVLNMLEITRTVHFKIEGRRVIVMK